MTIRGSGTVAAVIVTYNRADLLPRTLTALAEQTRAVDAIFVIDNASTDHTARVLADFGNRIGDLRVTRNADNTGGAGGFSLGMAQAFRAGFDRIWLMDDDVVPARDCLATLLRYDDPCLVCVREDLEGRVVEKAAITFDLANPLAIRPKTASVESTYLTRSVMPETFPVQNAAFEGFLVRREVIATIGLPDPDYFIFYDDVDFVIRARRAGFAVSAVRDAVMVRQLHFDQQHALDGWKGYYMYRNLFAVHFRYGENVLVRLKPVLIALVVVLLSPIRGGTGEARNVVRALRDARTMRRLPPGGPPLD